jgi:hypothetical protein
MELRLDSYNKIRSVEIAVAGSNEVRKEKYTIGKRRERREETYASRSKKSNSNLFKAKVK